jgi:hypothetical protein
VRGASGDDGRKQRARIQGPRCNEPVRQSTSSDSVLNRIDFIRTVSQWSLSYDKKVVSISKGRGGSRSCTRGGHSSG